MNTLILFTILITFQTPDWAEVDGIYYTYINNQFECVQYIPETGYIFYSDIEDVGLLDAMDAVDELWFLGTPTLRKGGFEKGFLYLEWKHEYRIIFFFNDVRFRVEVWK